jgi:hypothetical protein
MALPLTLEEREACLQGLGIVGSEAKTFALRSLLTSAIYEWAGLEPDFDATQEDIEEELKDWSRQWMAAQ